jgi:hypothetical protein
MRILEPARVFQSKTQHPIESNVANPNQRQHQRQMFASEESEPAQRQRADVSVDGVVRDRSDTSVESVAVWCACNSACSGTFRYSFSTELRREYDIDLGKPWREREERQEPK